MTSDLEFCLVGHQNIVGFDEWIFDLGVFISMVLIPTSQLGIRAKVNDHLGSSVGVSISLVLILAS